MIVEIASLSTRVPVVREYEALTEPPTVMDGLAAVTVSARLCTVIVIDVVVDASEWFVPSATVADTSHVPEPAVTVITPEVEFTEHAVEEPAEYVTVPSPAEGVAVTVRVSP